jgi:hypothetical protein
VTEPLAHLEALVTQATTTPRFPANSRYHTTPIARIDAPDGRTLVYLRRRFVPPPEAFATLREHVVTQGERLDAITALYLADPELFWRLCDANAALRPDELTETVGRRIRIPLPEGVPGGPDGR